jgi:myo-inositol-1(or 4)-monophosphatase
MSHVDRYVGQMKTVMQNSSGMRRAGAAALDLAYVAAGRFDAFWELGLSPWDMAAGSLMIQEAGGLVGDLAGDSGFLEKGEIAAATPKVFPELLRALA